MRKKEELEKEALNSIYQDLAHLVGVKGAIKIYKHYKGLQVNFPTRLYNRNYVVEKAREAARQGKNTREVAVKYDYSERWLREILKEEGGKKNGR